MSRRPAQNYNCRSLELLRRQLTFTPPAKRIEQVRRAERLHDELDPAKAYPFDFIAYRITGYRSESKDSSLLVGAAIMPDLRLMIDALSRSVEMPADDEPVESPQALADRFHVSTKTIARWRKLGLRWRWVSRPEGGRKQLMFTQRAVERFLDQHQHRVERASRFTQIGQRDRMRLIERARRIARVRNVSLNQAAAHLARRSGRSLEALRMLLEQYDRDHPEGRIFPDHAGTLTPRQKRVIVRAYRMGVSVSRIAERFGRTPSTVYRAIHDRHAADLRRQEIHYAASPLFERDDADEVFLRPEPESEPKTDGAGSATAADDLPEPLRPLYNRPVLNAQRQRSLFLRMNYLKFKAARARDNLDRYEPRAAELDQIDSLLVQAAAIRDRLVAANLPTILSVARRHLIGHADQSTPHLIELLEIGNRVVIDAVDRFNAARDQPFESYLMFVLMRRFASDESARPTRARARAKFDADAAVQRIRDLAGESGVDLTLEGEIQ
ncbi:MAG: helix-turn-helix domain-containing protein [Phycisphaeraceae bacterium]